MSPKPADKEEYQRLAAQMLDAWQKNITTIMNDSDVIRLFMQMIQMSGSGTKDFIQGNFFGTPSATCSGTAPDTGDTAVADLAKRLAGLEHRITLLEHSLAGFMSAFHAGTVSGLAGTVNQPAARKSSGSRVRKKGH